MCLNKLIDFLCRGVWWFYPHPWSPYLEDVDGSWLEMWRMGSFLTSWIIFGDPQEVILKVSWRSDFIWLSYYSTNANIHMLRQKDPLCRVTYRGSGHLKIHFTPKYRGTPRQFSDIFSKTYSTLIKCKVYVQTFADFYWKLHFINPTKICQGFPVVFWPTHD